ncbi:hypothetical protein C9374_014019 [Naegleria lovaniensis]|uniref:ATP-dependent DNA helicase n=1 Tax=Naegleria lovaniensis TaxID=51637 RepID=A0AA88H0W2_NAELO|nr:uncharacterized protein C9374_014019 [Naegleria lovaniensis]KAG2389459.1 hypothetical protein C9374_014019 [Naegleria lovaniensis]
MNRNGIYFVPATTPSNNNNKKETPSRNFNQHSHGNTISSSSSYLDKAIQQHHEMRMKIASNPKKNHSTATTSTNNTRSQNNTHRTEAMQSSLSSSHSIPSDLFPELANFDMNECENYSNLLSKLSDEQLKVLKCAIEGHSIFITGVAGTGKSFLLECIIKTLTNVYQKKVVVTASTGIAAVNIGGSTIHSFAGIRTLDNGKVDSKTAWRNDKEWQSTDVLIIDEISMIDAQYFDQLESIATEIRCFFEIATSKAPQEIVMKQLPSFGGIQVILCGDFLQLPPVAKPFKNEHGETVYQKKEMCFKAKCWSKTIKYTFELTNVFRQEEQQWVSILNSIRTCRIDSNAISQLSKLQHNRFDGMEKSTVIHTLNKNVDGVNESELLKLTPPHFIFKDHTYFSYGEYDPGVDPPTTKESIRNAILSNFNSSNAAQEISLRVGAQVMMIKNDFTNQLVNGTRGEVIGFVKQSAQDLYSTTKTLKPYAQTWIDENGELFPKVIFTREENGKEYKIIKIVHPAIFETDGPKKSKGTRLQIPLKLAYAMTVHKTQGLTLDKCVIDLSTVFSPGQIYVALSRAKTMKYLQVKNFNASTLTRHINREAIEFYREISKNDSFIPHDKSPKEIFIATLLSKHSQSFAARKKQFEDILEKIDLEGISSLTQNPKKRKTQEASSSGYSSEIMKKTKMSQKPSTLESANSSKRSGKYYCVASGRKPGIYLTWEECKTQVDNFRGAKFKSFPTLELAEQYMKEHGINNY